MSNYLQYVPKTLQEDFINNNVVPIVGAGFSKNAMIPKGLTMPDWDQLGRKIASYIMDYEYTNALDSLSIFESEYSRVKLIEILSKELHIHEIKPSATYTAFCNIFFDTICTTNFDFLLDETLNISNRPVSIIVSEEKLSININERTKLIKLHGDFNHPNNMVITERDYDEFLQKNKILATYISNLFITKTLFLVGYSFDDNDIRNIWQIINSRLGKLNRLAYCVMVEASRTEIARFERRNIKVINLPGKKANYANILEDFFNEVKELISQKAPALIQTTDNKLKEELALPNTYNRLCYLASSYKLMSQIKENIYPILAKFSITPIALDEVIYPTDNWLSKSELIMNKASFAIIDISDSNQNVQWELTQFLKSGKDVILIANRAMLIDYPIPDLQIIYYSSLDDEDFLSKLHNTIEDIKQKLPNEGIEEAVRLLDKKEYNSAAISAYRYLEDSLRKSSNVNMIDCNNKQSLNSMLRSLTQRGLLDINKVTLSRYSQLRNDLVHTNISISKQQAYNVIHFVENVLDSLSTIA
jgi:hypothetical protein